MESNAYYRNMFQLSPISSLLLLPKEGDYTILEANSAFNSLFELKKNIIGKPLSFLYEGLIELDKANFYPKENNGSLMRSIQNGNTQRLKDICFSYNSEISNSLETKFANIENIPIFNELGEIRYILHTLTDVTENHNTNKSLHDEEEKLKFVLENTSDAVIVFGPDHKIKFVSPNYIKQLGYAVEEELGRDINQISYLIHPEDRDIVFTSIFNVISNLMVSLLYTYRVLNKSGNYIWREDHAKFNYDENGNYLGAFVICRDISERKQIETDLEETKEKYRGLSEASFESIFISEKGVCIEQNLTAEKIFGYSNEEALGRMGTDWIIPECRELVMKNMIAGIEVPYEAVALRKDGSTFPCMLQGKMMNFKGRIVRVTSLTDISLRKKAEEEMRRSNDRFNLVAKATHDSIWDVNILTGEIDRIGEGFETLFGYKKGEDFRSDKTLIDLIHPEDYPQVTGSLFQAYSNPTNNLWKFEYRVIKKDGNIAYVHDNGFIIRNEKGEAIRMIGATRDVTERVNYVKAIETQNAKLKEIAWVQSHIVRAPLARMMGLIELIEEENQADQETKQLLQYILGSANEFDEIIKKIIENAKSSELLAPQKVPVFHET